MSGSTDAASVWDRICEGVDSARAAKAPKDEQWEHIYQSIDAARAATDRKHELLQYLYVTSVGLLESRTPAAVVDIIVEVLENLVGATSFLVLVWSRGSRYSRIAAQRGAVPPTPELKVMLEGDQPRLLRRDGQHRLAVAPIRHAGALVGAIVVGELLPQKGGELSEMDVELLRLLGGQAGPALAGTGQLARAENEVKVVRELLTAPKGKAAGLQGDLSDTPLIEVIQLISMIRKSGRLVLTSGGELIEFHFVAGCAVAIVVDGQRQGLTRASALLCAWLDRTGSFEFFIEEMAAQEGKMSCDELLLDALRLHDEQLAGTGREWIVEGS
jgi:hypothetical protein